MSDDWSIKGMEELGKTIAEMTKSLNPDKVEPILSKGARKMSSALRKNAPEGLTGNLKRSAKTKKLKPLTWNSPAASIAAIDHKIAPHAWLVENRGKSKGYFRRTVDENSQEVINTVSQEVEKLIAEAMK